MYFCFVSGSSDVPQSSCWSGDFHEQACCYPLHTGGSPDCWVGQFAHLFNYCCGHLLGHITDSSPSTFKSFAIGKDLHMMEPNHYAGRLPHNLLDIHIGGDTVQRISFPPNPFIHNLSGHAWWSSSDSDFVLHLPPTSDFGNLWYSVGSDSSPTNAAMISGDWADDDGASISDDPHSQLLSSMIFASRELPLLRYRNGMFPSEAFAIALASVRHNVSLILESGTADGASTQLLARTLPAVPLLTYDLDYYNLHQGTSEALAQCCPNVRVHLGNSLRIFPRIIEAHRNFTIGLVIDGPKGHEALVMARHLIQYPNVAFIAIHDTAPYWGVEYYNLPGVSKLSTWTTSYREKYVSIDRRAIAAHVHRSIEFQEGLSFKDFVYYGPGLDLFERI